MRKAEIKELAKKYGMDIVRHPVTREGHGVMVRSAVLIPELDKYADGEISALPCAVLRTCDIEYTYAIECPTSWFDLWGWRD